MNVQDYISSGIVESYVLGLASPGEQAEFESMCKQYPEVIQARNDFENNIGARSHAKRCGSPSGIKTACFECCPAFGG